YDDRRIRSSEMLFMFTIPVQLLPRNSEIHQTYSLLLEDQTTNTRITLKALFHCNDMPPDPPSLIQAKSQMDMEKAQMDEIALAADREAAFADKIAQQAQELANALIQEAKEKAEQAIAAAKSQAMGEAAAAEAARAEARLAKEKADAQINEAKKAQAEAQNIIQRSKLIRQKSVASGTSNFSSFLRYRAMLNDKTPEDEVKQQMLDEGIDSDVVDQFLESIRSHQQRVRDLENEVNALKRTNDEKRKQQSESPQNEELDELPKETLIRRYLNVMKQLQQNGITVAEEIPYEEAKQKIKEISERMSAMGSTDVKNPEYFQLEKDMEKYTAALLLSDEYIAEEARKEQEWEDQHREANEAALKSIRRMMPVNIKNMTMAQLQAEVTPNGKRMTQDVISKFKRTNVLELLRTDPQVLFKGHPGIVSRFNLVGLTITERQALHLHLREIGEKWKSLKDNDMMAKKYIWYKSLKDAFKCASDAYNKHVAQYGPPGNHPYATREMKGVGCPLLGKQCPLKANALPNYNQDWGYPEGPVYGESPTVVKTGVDDAAKQIQEEKERLFKAKAADARVQQREQSLKAHYSNSKGALVLVKAANGAIENMEELIDKIESYQMKWFKRILEHTATNRTEVDDWQSLISEIRLSTIAFAERSGMNLSGVRNPEKYSRDTRSKLEIIYCKLVCECVLDCFQGIDERMKVNQYAEEKRIRGDIGALTDILKELMERSNVTLSRLHEDELSISRKLKSRRELLSKVKKELEKEKAAVVPRAADEELPQRPPHPFLGGRGRGNPLMDAISKRGKKVDNENNDDDTTQNRPVNPLLAAIQARRKITENTQGSPPERPFWMSEASLIELDLPSGSKLGIAITPPKHGVTIRGLKIDKVQNELFIGKISHGDLLLEIGGTPLDGMKFADAVNLIKTMPRPLQLTFEIVPMSLKRQATTAEVDSLDENVTSYNVVFDDAKMGLALDDGTRFGIDGAIVKGVRDFAEDAGITPGDIVYKVNGTEVLFMSLKQVQNLIKATLPPRSIDFIPKNNLEDVQRMNLTMSVAEKNVRLAKAKPQQSFSERSSSIPEKSITEIIKENRATVIKEGPMYKQGRMVKNWKLRHVVLAVTKLEYFKDANDKVSQGVVNFENCRCTVRSLPSQSAKQTGAPGEYMLELMAGDRQFVMACTSEEEKMEWLEALKVAIDASKALCRTNSQIDALRQTSFLRQSTRRMASMSEESGLSMRSTTRRSSVNNLSLNIQPIPELTKEPSMHISNIVQGGPTVDIEVVSIQNLTKPFFHVQMNPYCEVTLGSETFKTPVVKDSLNPKWSQDNRVTFGVPSEDALIEIRVFDERMIRAAELLSTFTIPLQSLPNKTKIEQNYSLILADRSAHASITLSLRYNNDELDSDDTATGPYEMRPSSIARARNQMEMERFQMDQITSAADREAADADRIAKQAQEVANSLVEEARKKAEKAIAAAKKEALGERAAAEAAITEARAAQEKADAQMAEAKKAQEEAQKLIQRSKLIKQKSFASGTHLFSNFLRYRAMLNEKATEEEVKGKMLSDGIDEEAANQFLESMRSNQQRMRELEKEVESLKRDNSVKRKQLTSTPAAPPAPRESAAEMLQKGAMSSDQEQLLRRLLKLEKQLQQAGIAVADDIPYEEAKKKVHEISTRMGEIGSADVTHPDPKVQKELREEYFKLEQDMEKYNGALMLTDEYAAEQARKEKEWEDENKEANEIAVLAIRRMMPVKIKEMSEAQLQTEPTPNGKKFTREIALKYKRTNVLEILRTSPQDILKTHPSILEGYRVTGLTVTERRALHMHLREIAETWKAQQKEEMSGRKYSWFKSLKDTFKTAADAYNRHVAQYGPPGNHPYATRDEPGVGCPMIGKQCPLKADASPAYTQDWGYPEGPEFMQSSVLKSNADDAGKQAMEEAARLLKAKAADARAQQRSDGLKAHYSKFKGALVLVKGANGAIENMEELVDKVEAKQMEWFRRIIEGKATNKAEVADWDAIFTEIRLSTIGFAERSGMNLAGRRNPDKDTPDTRSNIEIRYCNLLCEAVLDCFHGIDTRMKKNKFDEEKRIRGAIGAMTDLLQELKQRGNTTISTLSDQSTIARKLKPHTELLAEVKEEIKKEKAAAAPPAPAAEEIPERPPNPMMGGRGRGNPLMAAIQNRKKGGDDDDAPPARPNPFGGRGRGNPLMAAIQSRGKKGDDDDDAPPARPNPFGGRGGGNPLMAAIQARGKVADDDEAPARPANPLMAAIKARGKVGGDDEAPARPANPLMAAIQARGKVGGDDDEAPPARPANPLMAAIAARKKIE
ncbi:hypothetical protein THRCLA_04843, partial [Thraustotheca clavata]